MNCTTAYFCWLKRPVEISWAIIYLHLYSLYPSFLCFIPFALSLSSFLLLSLLHICKKYLFHYLSSSCCFQSSTDVTVNFIQHSSEHRTSTSVSISTGMCLCKRLENNIWGSRYMNSTRFSNLRAQFSFLRRVATHERDISWNAHILKSVSI
jgi:hypothetical protein